MPASIAARTGIALGVPPPSIHHVVVVSGREGNAPQGGGLTPLAAGSRPVMMRITRRRVPMSDGFVALYIFMLAAIAGHVIISRVPVILHTPLMSGSNFIHGIVLIGAMVVLGHADTMLEKAIGFVAVLLGAGNAAGGYVVTERMLEMFKSSKPTPSKQAESKQAESKQAESKRAESKPAESKRAESKPAESK
jgi:NAD(P) transhydrogenase subunit alpha